MTAPESVRILAVLVVVLIAVALPRAASADESIEPVPESRTLVLQPGDNFVGWIGAPIAVADVFAAVPKALLIYTWDADSRLYRYAIRGVGGTLPRLDPGMAVTIRVVGDAPVEWAQPVTPVTGMTTLHNGVNWVAWSGREDWPLDEVARGIGKSLVRLEFGEFVYEPGSPDADMAKAQNESPLVARGDGLRVTVNRDVRWLQPTGILPNVVWVGKLGQKLRDEISADIRRVLDYFADELAVETDFAKTTILVWHGVEAALEYQKSGQEPQFYHGEPAALRARLTAYGGTGGGTEWGLYVAACWWSPPCPQQDIVPATEFMAHEWFHYLQLQLAGRDWYVTPQWLLEGAAVWAAEGLPVANGENTFSSSRESYRRDVARTSATLESAEQLNDPWQYFLGVLAVDLLAANSDRDAPIEYLRLLYPQALEPERRWSSEPDWQAAFRGAFGFDVQEFYTEFERWRGELPLTGPRYDYNQGDRKLQGTLHFAGGTPADGFRINVAAYEGDVLVARERSTIVGDEGTFSIDLAPKTEQRIWVTHDSCELWLTDDGLVTRVQAEGRHRTLSTRDLPMLQLVLPKDACRWHVATSVLSLRGDQRRINVGHWAEDQSFAWAGSHPFGGFSWFAPAAGRYRVMVQVGGCDLWLGSGDLVASRDAGKWILVGDQGITLQQRIPDDLCVRRISGRLVGSDGLPIPGLWISAGWSGMSGTAYSDANGQFTITVPASGRYHLSINENGCSVVHGPSGPTRDWAGAAVIEVGDEDVSSVEFSYRDLCSDSGSTQS